MVRRQVAATRDRLRDKVDRRPEVARERTLEPDQVIAAAAADRGPCPRRFDFCDGGGRRSDNRRGVENREARAATAEQQGRRQSAGSGSPPACGRPSSRRTVAIMAAGRQLHCSAAARTSIAVFV